MKSTRKWLALSLTISVIAIIAILIITVTEETYESLTRIQPVFLLLAVGIRASCWLAYGSRLKVLSKVLGVNISLINCIKIVLSGAFAAGITPSYVGGEPVRIYLLNREGLTLGDAAAVDLGGRILDGLVLGSAFPFAWFIFRDIIKSSIVISSAFVLVGILFCAAAGIGVYGFLYPKQIKKILNRLEKSELINKITFEKSGPIINRISIEIDNFRDGILRFFREGKKGLFLALFSTIAFWFFLFVLVPFVLMGLGMDPMWIPAIAAQIILMVLVSVPVSPGGSGIAEIGAASLYATILPEKDLPILGIFVVLWRFVTYYVPLLVGGVVSLKVLKDLDLSGLGDSEKMEDKL